MEHTFSYQNTLPPLPVPDLNETLNKYLKSACVLLNESEKAETVRDVEDFRKSRLAAQLQEALKKRASSTKNWIEEWWYDAYCEVRDPLTPYLSVASIQGRSPSQPGSQILRAADTAHHLMHVWKSIREQKYPITKSRGVVWDMHQYHTLFNSTRCPALPKDQMLRYFKTELEGSCPSNMIIICRGNFWNCEMIKNGQIISPDELYAVFDHVQKNSVNVSHCVATLTVDNRDTWAKMRSRLVSLSIKNKENVQKIEEATFCFTLTDDEIADDNEVLTYSMMGRSYNQWADKNMNIHVMKDGQMSIHADHSNVDAIVILEAGNITGKNIRHDKWTPKHSSDYVMPKRLEFDLDSTLVDAINVSDRNFEKLKKTIGVQVVRFHGYGNEKLRKIKMYGDTVIQLSMQLAYAKTHNGEFAPIYETASTRKFYHGRTETVRGRTQEMVDFGKSVLSNMPMSEQHKLFKAAYDAHNKLMAEAMDAKGCDRHLYGLQKTLEQFNKGGCGPKQELPALYRNKAWKHSGGGGNFKLSTSFIGYDSGGSYGYVCAMCDDGYGTFYKINTDSILLTATNYKNTASDLQKYSANIQWALSHLGTLIGMDNAKL